MNYFFKFVFLFVIITLVSCTTRTIDYWGNGNVKSELTYKNGKLHGECTWYFVSGLREQQAFYHQNKLDGRMLRWYRNGKQGKH